MPQVPFPITAENFTDMQRQVWELVRNLYEDRVGGLLVGDVFSGSTDILALNLLSTGGLEKNGTDLKVKLKTAGNLSSGADGLYLSGTGSFKLGTFTRNMEAATGDVSYTGVGFAPLILIFFVAVNQLVGCASWGIDNGTNRYSIYADVDNPGAFVFSNGYSIMLLSDNSPLTAQSANVKTLDTDGFTLAWVKGGTPAAGTANGFYLAMRTG